MKREIGKKLLGGVAVLTASTMLVKLLGFLYKIPMLSFLGTEGMGYFNAAYEIFLFFCMPAISGLPVALSVLLSGEVALERFGKAERIFQTAAGLFTALGVLGGFALFFFAGGICRLIQSPQTYLSLLAMAPAVLLVSCEGLLRGFFQGHGRMFPTALSQVLEALGKLLFGLLFAKIAAARSADLSVVAAAAGLGMTAGSFLSFLYLLIEKICYDKRLGGSTDSARKERSGVKKLLSLSLPITAGAALSSVTRVLDMGMILRALQKNGLSASQANETFGSYSTLALSVFGLLPALVSAVATPLLPLLSGAIAKGNREEEESVVAQTVRLVLLIGIPASFGVSAFAEPILNLLFFGKTQAVRAAAPSLSILGISVLLSCLVSAVSTMLHSYSVVYRPLFALGGGVLLKAVVTGLLLQNSSVGIMGASVGTLVCNLWVIGLDLHFLSQKVPEISFSKRNYILLFCGVFSVGAGVLTKRIFLLKEVENNLAAVGIFAFCAILYTVLLFFFGEITPQNTDFLQKWSRKKPKTAKIYKKMVKKPKKL